jgi:hypothetical protein
MKFFIHMKTTSTASSSIKYLKLWYSSTSGTRPEMFSEFADEITWESFETTVPLFETM